MNPAPAPAERAPRERRILRRPLRTLAIVFGAVLLAIGGTYAWWATAGHRLVTITEGQVYQSAEVEPDDLVALSRERGFKAVIDLRDTRPEAIEAEHAALEAAGIRHLHVPSLQEPTAATIENVLALMADPANRPLLIHCEHGEGRSVLFAALHRIENEGWSNEEAWRGASRLPAALSFLNWLVPGIASFSRNGSKGRILFGYESKHAPKKADGDSPR